MMTAFDLCDSTLPCGQRDVTIVAPQALTLLNNEFIHRRAETLATQILGSHPDSASARIDAVWRAVLNRTPAESEVRLAADHLQRQTERFQQTISGNSSLNQSAQELALASLCLVLFNSNEFI